MENTHSRTRSLARVITGVRSRTVLSTMVVALGLAACGSSSTPATSAQSTKVPAGTFTVQINFTGATACSGLVHHADRRRNVQAVRDELAGVDDRPRTRPRESDHCRRANRQLRDQRAAEHIPRHGQLLGQCRVRLDRRPRDVCGHRFHDVAQQRRVRERNVQQVHRHDVVRDGVRDDHLDLRAVTLPALASDRHFRDGEGGHR